MSKIIGNTTATPNPRPDWAQTDETKADYIKNKPTILTEDDVIGSDRTAETIMDIANGKIPVYMSGQFSDIQETVHLTNAKARILVSVPENEFDAANKHYVDQFMKNATISCNSKTGKLELTLTDGKGVEAKTTLDLPIARALSDVYIEDGRLILEDVSGDTIEFSAEEVLNGLITSEAYAQSLLGNEVAKAIEKLCAPEKTNERLSRLEAAAEGILFSYPIEDSACEVLRAPAHVMSYGALCRLGGAPIPQKNLLPEKILSTYRGENLTVTWDSAEGCLIFNGTVTAAEAPIVLAPFNSPATYGYYHAAIFPRSGSKIKPTGSGQVFLRFFAEDEKYISLDLSKDIPVTTGSLLRTGGKKFSRIVISTNTTMQFDNYKINILLQAGTCDEPVYAPYESLTTPSPIPSKITACSPNEWEGEFSKEGLGGVTFLPQKIFSSGQYAISFFATVEGAATTCHFHTYLENGRIIKRKVPTDERAQVLLEFDAPVTMFKIFPMATEEESAPYAIRVKDFQVERESPIYEFAYDFSTPYSHTLSLPESFSRYADRFIGMGNEICNHFDFERGMFVTTVKCYRMDDNLSFTADAAIASRFHAVATLPEDLIASTNYMSSSLFHPLIDETACDECIWFTEDGITIQSSLFKTAEDIPAFLRIHPIDILYEVPAEKEFLTPEEADFFSPPLLPVVPDASITLYDSSNTPVVGFIRMQYETQNLLEEEIV